MSQPPGAPLTVAERLAQHKEAVARRKVEAAAHARVGRVAVDELAHCLVERSNADAGLLFQRQNVIEAESRELQAQIQKFSQASQRWSQLFSQLNDALLELGSVETWSRFVQGEIKTILSNLETVQSVRTSTNPP